MGTMVDATVPTEQFALADVFDEVPDATVETVPVVAPKAGNVMPFLWVWAPDLDDVDRWFERDSSTESVRRLTRNEDRSLYQVEWGSRVHAIVSVLIQVQGTLLGATGDDCNWTFRVLFPEHDAVSATYDHCKEYGIDLSIRRVKGVTDSIDRNRVELSDKQYETLTTAFEMDYYSIPRGITLGELAEEVGVSHQALSERLRRGHKQLVLNALRVDGDEQASD